IESGDLKIIGINSFTETAESPLTAGGDSGIMKVDPAAEREQIERLNAFRAARNAAEVEAALNNLKDIASSSENIMPASIRCAHAGVTTGEWSRVLRDIFGEYRAPTGIDIAALNLAASDTVDSLRERTRKTGEELGRPLKILVGKPGLDGHSNGAEQIAVKARDVGFEVVYEGIRLTPEQIVKAAEEEGVHLIGLSVLSGSHLELVEDAMSRLGEVGLSEVPVIVGGIVPPEDEANLKTRGIAAVYTPKDSDMNLIMADLVNIIRESNGLERYGALH
ncbi:MAG: cobalamin-dependent protein, partial [Gammaproteobacteria bacterium]|nr:cobalamin-dependent protein [Gammaproteobacteria bacterium]